MDLTTILTQVVLVDVAEEVLILLCEDVSVVEMVIKDVLIEGVQLFNSILSDSKRIIVKDRLFWVIYHLSLHVLREGVVAFSLGKYVHLLGDDLDVFDVLERKDEHDNEVGHDTEDANTKLNDNLAI